MMLARSLAPPASIITVKISRLDLISRRGRTSFLTLLAARRLNDEQI